MSAAERARVPNGAPWNAASREDLWREIAGGGMWDVIVIGGGITGAGVARAAARAGYRTLIVDARDFAWGASSRSSKFVHGGLRYLPQGQWRVTRECVRERERLVQEAPGLVERIAFTRVVFTQERHRRWLYGAALAVYDAMSGHHDREWLDARGFAEREPLTAHLPLAGGYHFADAQTDDARMVLRVLREAARAGAAVRNYTSAAALLVAKGRVCGVRLRDQETGREAEAQGRVVVSAMGAASDALRTNAGAPRRMRPLRGSHLVFALSRVPLRHTISFAHPVDGRNVCVTPWEGRAIMGTTDLDHDQPLEEEPRATPSEVDYLMEAMRALFRPLALEESDILTTWAGVRPVVRHGASSTSRAATREARDTALANEPGLVTVTGGKLTTFHATAIAVLRRVARQLPRTATSTTTTRAFDAVAPDDIAPEIAHDLLHGASWRRLAGRHGADATALLACAREGEIAPIDPNDSDGATSTLTAAELRWAARAEGVVHLDDLLLRRTRLGVLAADGGAHLLPSIRRIVQPELAWSDARWADETARYTALHHMAYGVPRA